MAVTAGIVGAGMLVGGTAAAIRAQQMKTKPRGVTYGGSAGAQDAMTARFGAGVDRGAAAIGAGQDGLAAAASAGRTLAASGQQVMDSAGGVAPATVSRAGSALLGAYQPGAVTAAQTQQVLDQNATATLGAARSGGALGLRNAITANAGAGVEAAQGLAVARAQEEQQLLAARVQQENADRAAQLDAYNQAQQQKLQTLQVGAGMTTAGTGQALTASGQTTQAGLNNQAQYLGQQQNVVDQQAKMDADYEKARHEDMQRKANNWFNLGSSMVGIGGKAFGVGAG